MDFEIIKGSQKDLGGLSVVRSLPVQSRRSVGPFIFLDHLGPLKLTENSKLDVNPHPHIGLSTVTYLFQGQGLHKDSLGYSQVIKPGEINWMTAGKGIVHSERTPEELLKSGEDHYLHGIQFWVALPVEHEKVEPFFSHYPSETLPSYEVSQKTTARLLIGEYEDKKSPVKTFSKTLFKDFKSEGEDDFKLNLNEKELGIFVISGSLKIQGQSLEKDELLVLKGPLEVHIKSLEQSRFVIIGGTPFNEKRYMWWNFVSSRLEDIQEAAELWKNQKMGKVESENNYTPLPDYPFPKK